MGDGGTILIPCSPHGDPNRTNSIIFTQIRHCLSNVSVRVLCRTVFELLQLDTVTQNNPSSQGLPAVSGKCELVISSNSNGRMMESEVTRYVT